MSTDEVIWRGSPRPGQSALIWAALAALGLGLAALVMWYAQQTGRCVPLLMTENCDPNRRFRLEIFIYGGLGLGALCGTVAAKVALGFPQERYEITRRDLRRIAQWPMRRLLSQPLAHASVTRQANTLRFTGAGKWPVTFGPLTPEEANHVLRIIQDLKAAP